jgi:tetratricopeptide (TPR) repeat protein
MPARHLNKPPKQINGFADIPTPKTQKTFIAANGPGGARQLTAQAQVLADAAWNLKSTKARLNALAKILDYSPLCADGYSMVAATLELTPAERITVYERGITAATFALGDDFKRYQGEFWTFVETRPYMRAASGLALTYLAERDYETAIKHFRALLELNPSDEQANRYPLLACLLNLGLNTKANRLIEEYKDISDYWLYSKLLLAFRAGLTPPVKKALRANPRIPAELASPTGVEPYVTHTHAAWAATPGAIAWLNEAAAEVPPLKRKGKPTRAIG